MVFYKYHGCGNDFVLIDEITNADYRSLADRLCFADGNLANVIATGHACDDQLVIRDEHGVGVVIASVKPLLNIAFNRIHANNIGRKITLPWVILKKLFKSAPKKSAELRVVTGLLFVIFRLMKIIII